MTDYQTAEEVIPGIDAEKLLEILENPDRALNTAIKYHTGGKLDEARGICDEALALYSDDLHLLNLRAMIAFQQGNHTEAVARFRHLSEQSPETTAYKVNYGGVLLGTERFEEAIKTFNQLLENEPDSPQLLNNLALALKGNGELEEAIGVHRQVIKHAPDYAEAHNSLGAALKDKGDLPGAEDSLRKSLEINPNNAEAYFNLSRILRAKGQFEEALSSARRALRFKPDYADAQEVCATALLSTGNLKDGWKEYEFRGSAKSYGRFVDKAWMGEDPAGKTFLVWAEQGIGDQIMFANCLPDLINQSGQCIIEMDKRLVPLFARSFPKAKVHGNVKFIGVSDINSSDFEWLTDYPPIDYFCFFGSLPCYLRPTIDSFPSQKSYLKADPERVDFWRNRLEALGPGNKVGISWRSFVMHKGKERFFAPLENWEPIFSLSNTHLICLQAGVTEEELEDIHDRFGDVIHVWEDLDLADELDETAALVSALDAVVSCDTYLPMMSGALGVPTWRYTRSMKYEDWSHLGQDKYPWFSNYTLKYAMSDEGIEVLFRQFANELEAFFKGKRGVQGKTKLRSNKKNSISKKQKAKLGSNSEKKLSELMHKALALHQQENYSEAEPLYRQVLKSDPGHADTLHYLGILKYQTGNFRSAAELIERAAQIEPGNFTYQVNLGNALKECGHLKLAEEAFRRGLDLAPMSSEACNNLAAVLIDRGQYKEAKDFCERAVELVPGYAVAHDNLGRSLVKLGKMEEGIRSLEKALSLEPESPEILNDFGETLMDLGQYDDAISLIQKSLVNRPNFFAALYNLGNAFANQGDMLGAQKSYKAALSIRPEHPGLLSNLAFVFERRSMLKEARVAAAEALGRREESFLAALVMAKCDRRDGKLNEALERLLALPQADITPEFQQHINFEFGHLYDRLKDFSRAYTHFQEANRLSANQPKAKILDRNIYVQEISNLSEHFKKQWIDTWTPQESTGNPQNQPAFLVGFPRSGTTLLGRVLDAHPKITVLDEKNLIAPIRSLLDKNQTSFPDILAQLKETEIKELREAFISRAEFYDYKQKSGNRLIDKMPFNLAEAGLIHRLWPRAKFIFMLRHPADSCLSSFMQDFQPNRGLINFDTIERTVALYTQIMTLWQQYCSVLGLNVHTVRYEDVVEDMETEVRHLTEFLELPWQEEVLNYAQKTDTTIIHTPSYNQITEPIYRRAMERWRNYKTYMEPYFPALRPFCERFGYDLD